MHIIGSKSSTINAFLEAVMPKIAIIGVGENNLFNHPSEITIENLEKQKISIYRTDQNGEITIRTNGKKIKETNATKNSCKTNKGVI